jgi:hypothetical protein
MFTVSLAALADVPNGDPGVSGETSLVQENGIITAHKKVMTCNGHDRLL